MDSGPQKVRSDATEGVVFEEEATHKGDRGMVLSSYAPVRNAEGRAVALVGLDTAGTYFEVPDRSVWTFGLGTFAVSVLIGLPAALLLAGRLSHPVAMLRTGMQRLAGGELDTQLPVRRRGDEFDDLMRQFNATAAGLREREEMRRSLETASEVQQHLLPQRTCEIPGYELCTAVRYCDETGGDYADCFPLEDDAAADERPAERWGVAVGDVTGHGVASALLMAWTRAMVRATAPMHADDVSAMMRLVNRHLLRDSDSGTFLTLFFGALDARTNTLAWVSAGHEPAVVVRAASGALELLGATDVPLGIEGSPSMPHGAVVRLEPGDVVVIGTDGVTQARSPSGEFFGSERMAEVVRAEMVAGGTDGASVTRMREALFAAVAAHRCGAAQDDDETFVVVKRRR
jgi:sigma-B regulation protein RsbU (phosphoserine phosphatase)